MKKLIIFSVCLTVFFANANAASQRRGTAAASSATDTGTATVSARAATRTSVKSSPSTSSVHTTSARSATPSAPAPKTTVSARAATSQKVISSGTKIQTASKNILVDEMCQEQFQGCMDAFCMLENDSGGRCQCSDRKSELDGVLAEIEKLDAQSYKLATEGVEKLEMGSSADAVIATANQTVKDLLDEKKDETKRRSLDLSLWDDSSLGNFSADENIFDIENQKEDITDKTGNDLYMGALEICSERLPACGKDLEMLCLMYVQNVKTNFIEI